MSVAPLAHSDEEASLAFLSDVYRQALLVRAFEAKAQALSETKPPMVLGSMHLCAGQEIVPIAALAAARDDDQVICTYRGHGWALAAGVPPLKVMAEICHRATGLNGGRAGSAYMMAPETRFIGENSIVGAGATIACGVALANQHQGNGRVVLVSIGDGALNQGSVHEAMAFAAVKKLPVVFIVENNGWSEMTATSEMFRVDRLAQRARGYGIPSATISGTDAQAVFESVKSAVGLARDGNGPSLLECKVPRLWGHYNRDVEHYRSKADRANAQTADPLVSLEAKLTALGLAKSAIDALKDAQRLEVEALAKQALAAPAPAPATARDHLTGKPEHKTLRVSETRSMSYVEAVNLALRTELENDPRVLFFGEDVGRAGGIFAAARYLQRDFGEDRVFDTPIAENAILGSAVGAALAGMRPVAEIMWADFVFVALDQLVNQAANVRYLTQGRSSAPLVVRMQQGATPGSCSQHSQSIEAILAHVPGLNVALAATPQDAYALLRSAIADPDPCIVIESRSLYPLKGEVGITDVAEPVGVARSHRDGQHVAIVTWGAMLHPALEAADLLALEDVQASVLDLRWISPLDEEALFTVADRADGRVLVVHEAVRTGGFGAEIAMRIIEHREAKGLGHRVTRLATPDTRIPAAPNLQAELIPSVEKITEKVREIASRFSA